MHIGILCPTMTGHINSVTPLGFELQKRGHRVTFFQLADAKERILSAGLEFQAIAQDCFPVGSYAQF